MHAHAHVHVTCACACACTCNGIRLTNVHVHVHVHVHAHVHAHEHVARVQGQRAGACMRMCIVSLIPFVLSPHCVWSNIISRVRLV